MTPEQYCEQKALAPGSSFYYSVLFLPRYLRRAVITLWAFRRELADTVDQASDPGLARTKLLWWRDELTSALAGQPQHPVTRALVPVVASFQLPHEQLFELIDGAQMDLDYNRYPDFATLEVYCYRTSGVVALLSARILGYTQPATLEFARALGTALQLASMVRDMGESARRNRIYVPLDELQRFGVSTDDIIGLREDERIERLLAYQIDRTRSCFERALALLPQEDRKAQRPNLILAAIYRTLIDEIARLHGRILNQRVALTPLRKLWIAWRTS